MENNKTNYIEQKEKISITKKRRQQFRKTFFAKKIVIGAFVLICIMCFLAVFADFIAPYGNNEQDLTKMLAAPSAEHIFGTDQLGRDTFSRIIYGARVSMIVSIVSTAIAGVIGMGLGLLSGIAGRWIDSVIMRIMDAMMTIPVIILAIFMGVLFGKGLMNVCICIGIAMVPTYARLTRGLVLQIKQLDYVTASVISGSKPVKVALKHILPNCLPALIVLMTMNLGAAIMIEAGLSYLGIGVVPPDSSWGYLINYGRTWLNAKPYMSIAPGIFIILTAWAFNICGDALRDALDPKLRGRL